MNIIKKSIDDIKPNDYNPNKIDNTKFKALVENIKKFGYVQPILIDNTNVIIDGEHRFKACKEAGLTEIECVVYDGNTDIKEYRKLLTLSMNNLRGEVEQENFEQVIKDLAYSMDYEELESLTGFDVNTISDIVQADKYADNEDSEDDVPEMDECLVIKAGDIIELGKHRLLCGDSTIKESVDVLMDNSKANLYFTDPQYSVNYSKKAKEVLKSKNYIEIKNDNMSVDETSKKLWSPVFKNAYNACSDDASFYMTMPQGGDQMMMMMMMMNENWQVKHELIWVKDAPVFSMNRLDYDYMHEPIAYGWKKKHNFYRKGLYQKSVWHVKRTENKLHPTMKPVELIENAVNNSTMTNCIVLDTFLGSGSTLIACEKTGRICYGMELDQHYCSVIIERYCKYVDNQKIKINGKDIDWNEYKTGEKQA